MHSCEPFRNGAPYWGVHCAHPLKSAGLQRWRRRQRSNHLYPILAL